MQTDPQLPERVNGVPILAFDYNRVSEQSQPKPVVVYDAQTPLPVNPLQLLQAAEVQGKFVAAHGKYEVIRNRILNAKDDEWLKLKEELPEDFEGSQQSFYLANKQIKRKAVDEAQLKRDEVESKLQIQPTIKGLVEIHTNENLAKLTRIEKQLKEVFMQEITNNHSWDAKLTKLFLLINQIDPSKIPANSKEQVVSFSKRDLVNQDKEDKLLRGKVELALKLLEKKLFLTDLITVNEEPHELLKHINFAGLLEKMSGTLNYLLKVTNRQLTIVYNIFGPSDDYVRLLIICHLTVGELHSNFIQNNPLHTDDSVQIACKNFFAEFQSIKEHFYAALESYKP